MKYRMRTIRGFSLVEMLVYIGVLTLIFLVVISTFLSFSSTYKSLVALRTIEHSATESLERITRDIRAASGITVSQSAFGVNPGTLTLTTSSGGAVKTTAFYTDNGTLKVNVNGAYVGPLTARGVRVTNIVFNMLPSVSSNTAVKVDLTLEAARGSVTETRSYHTTVVLRGI